MQCTQLHGSIEKAGKPRQTITPQPAPPFPVVSIIPPTPRRTQAYFARPGELRSRKGHPQGSQFHEHIREVFNAKITNVDRANPKNWERKNAASAGKIRGSHRERRTGLSLSSPRERARTSHNGNSRKFVCMIMLGLEGAPFTLLPEACQRQLEKSGPPQRASLRSTEVPSAPPSAETQPILNRSYERLHRPFRPVLILGIMDINLHAREASMFSICCLRLIFRCVRRCVLHLKRRSLRLRSRSFRSSTVIRRSRSSTCFSSSLIS
jgi:hypothetical protein